MCLEFFRPYFLLFTPFNLLLTLFVFFKVNKEYSKKFFLLSFLIFLIGYAVEAIGVATGVLFGSYAYGSPFGFKVFETPLLIGVNWLFLSLSTYGVVEFFTKKGIWLILVPAFLMTALDFLIEPVAMKLGFWGWENDIIPLQNYGMWFLTSLVIHAITFGFRPKINSKISFVIVAVQFLFFGILCLVL
ncbi:carotenoid biosynthesis protein [uncultured Polaribacter sp.]|uniref:carotenoid biosynthesis protein n=1 Tax=uncultured Polaribacter sp. TaxID=174711 RepID=UPI00263056D9|nr:carotenoid biosynthesis protein [uncultured Polaribacter sp.]